MLGCHLDGVGLLHRHNSQQLVPTEPVGDGGKGKASLAAQKQGLGPLGGQVLVVGLGQGPGQGQLVESSGGAACCQGRGHVARETVPLGLFAGQLADGRGLVGLGRPDSRGLALGPRTLVHRQPLLDVRQRDLAGRELGEGVGRGHVQGPGGLVAVLRRLAGDLPRAQLARLQGLALVGLGLGGAAASTFLAAHDAVSAFPGGHGPWHLETEKFHNYSHASLKRPCEKEGGGSGLCVRLFVLSDN